MSDVHNHKVFQSSALLRQAEITHNVAWKTPVNAQKLMVAETKLDFLLELADEWGLIECVQDISKIKNKFLDKLMACATAGTPKQDSEFKT